MNKAKLLLVTTLSCLIYTHSAQESPSSQSGNFQSQVIVGGSLQKAQYNVVRSQRSWFDRENYSQKSGVVQNVVSPNTIHVQTANRLEEFQLIGLMDISHEFNASLRQQIVDSMEQRLIGRKVMLHQPRDYQRKNLHHNHVFLMQGSNFINSQLLKEGLGILTTNHKIDPFLKSHFQKMMETASREGLGLWYANQNEAQNEARVSKRK